MPTLLEPAALSEQLRTRDDPDLRRRRWMIGLSFAGIAIGKIVTAYQTGMIRRLPDILPGPIFDAEKVDASDYAYRHLQMPDAAQMILLYGGTAAIASAGGADRASDNPALPVATAAKAGADSIACLVLAREEWRENQKLCSWCQVATLISLATFALSLPEAVRAWSGGRREQPA